MKFNLVIKFNVPILRPIYGQMEVSMAKAGMRRPDPSDPHGTESNKKHKFPKNDMRPVPEIKGKAKKGHQKAEPT